MCQLDNRANELHNDRLSYKLKKEIGDGNDTLLLCYLLVFYFDIVCIIAQLVVSYFSVKSSVNLAFLFKELQF